MSEINFFIPAPTGDLRQVLGRQIVNCGRKRFLLFFAFAHSIFLQQITLDTSLESMYMATRKHMLLCARNLHSRRNECLEILMLIRLEDQEGAISNPGMGRVCEQRSRPRLTDTKEV